MKKKFKSLKIRVGAVWLALTRKHFVIVSPKGKEVDIQVVGLSHRDLHMLFHVSLSATAKACYQEYASKQQATTQEQMDEAVNTVKDIINGKI